MAAPPNATPTPITPPRVPLIDERTGLIDRSWYLFFLSLFRAAETTDEATLGSNTESLIASYDEALRTLAQTTETQPTSGVTELAQEVRDLRQEVQTLPQPQLGTFAALQQANLPWTTFDTTAQSVPTDIGTVAWDGGTTLNVQMTANVIQRVGESEFVYVKASATITKGQLCYHTGSVGSSGTITAAPTPIGLADPNQIVGVAAESIALNDFGLIQISGDLRGFNTTGSSVGETWADGDPLYYNPAYVGSMTKVKPLAPNQKTYVGEVINAGSGGSGSISIRLVPGSVLGGTDSNVQFSGLANNDLIQYSTALGYWRNITPASILIGTATNLAGGAAGSVPYQTGAGATTFLPVGTATQVLKVNAGATAPEWVSGAALSKTDDTNVTLTLGGSPTTSLLAATSLTLGWTGQLAVSRGGTGLSSGTSGGLPYYSSTTTLASSALLTANALMVGGGAGAAPSTITTGTGVVTALGVNTGAAGAFVVNGGALGTPSSGTVTNLTGTASININGSVGATTPNTGAFTTLSASSTVTFSGGTANGVLYLNASKVATSGSALTFDGTNFGVGLANPSTYGKLAVTATTGTVALYAGSSTQGVYISNSTGTEVVYNASGNSAGVHVWQTGNNEQMRLTSTGLGIGTTSNLDNSPLQVDANGVGSTVYTALFRNTSTSTSAYNVLRFIQGASGSATGYLGTGGSAVGNTAFQNTFVVGTQSSSDLVFSTGDTARARITSAGNVVAGASVALATNATDGFLYVPTCAGTPTGTPTAITGMAPVVVDTTNNKLYFYSGGAWRDAGP